MARDRPKGNKSSEALASSSNFFNNFDDDARASLDSFPFGLSRAMLSIQGQEDSGCFYTKTFEDASLECT